VAHQSDGRRTSKTRQKISTIDFDHDALPAIGFRFLAMPRHYIANGRKAVFLFETHEATKGTS
jgi:hypothetical protein